MLNVCCIRAGTAFGPEYVNILYDSVRRNLPDGFEGRFVCFTDQSDALSDGIEVRPLPVDLPKWWSKLGLFKPWLFPHGERVLFLDLDTVITGRLDELAAYDGPFAILRDFYRQDGLQSAVMAWRAGEATDIWDTYREAGCPTDIEGGDQAWIERAHLDARRLQDEFPSLFASYKAHNLTRNPPEAASVVVFHGKPRPHEIVTGWVPEVWKIGGMTRADLDTICNTSRDQLMANVMSAIVRDLEWFDTAKAHDGHVVLVGGGPSTKDKIEEIRWRQSIGQTVWALNGAGRMLAAHGIAPDALVIVDARPENAEFLSAPAKTVMLSSQCDPSLFDAAKGVVLFHINSEGMANILADERERPVHLIGGGSTVGLNAMVLAFAAGYRNLHLYGYDSSFVDGAHHAYAQPGNDADLVIDAIFDGRKFKTTPWMAQQVTEFQDLVPGLLADGCTITVAGNGLLPTVARAMIQDMPLLPFEERAAEILERIAGIENPVGAEIGVFAGDLSAALLRSRSDLTLYMVDSWEGEGAAYAGDSGDFHARLSNQQQSAYMDAAMARTAFARDRRTVLHMRSSEGAVRVPSASLDFAFIDADHSYEGCAADIAAWAPKVKPGGWLCGHDYENTNFPKFGVTQAVTEYVQSSGLSLQVGRNFVWAVQIPSTGESIQWPRAC